MTEPAPGASPSLAETLAAFVSELTTRSVDDILQILREADLSLPRLVTLHYLSRAGAASISQIGEHLNLSLAATSSLVEQLVGGGYVTRTEDKGDRRHKQVELTAAGATLVARVRRARVAEVMRQIDELPVELRERLHAVLGETLTALRASELAAR